MWILRLLTALAVLLPVLAAAQGGEESLGARLDRWDAEARTIERRLEFDPPSSEEVDTYLGQLGQQLGQVPATRERLQSQLAPLRSQREALGDAPEDASAEAPQIGVERKRLDGEIGTLDAFAKRVDQAEARAKGLEGQLTQLRRDRFAEALLEKGPSLLDPKTSVRGLAAIERLLSSIVLETSTRISELSLDAATITRLVLPLLLLGGGIAVVLKLRAFALRNLIGKVTPELDLSHRVAVGAGLTLVRLLLPFWAVGMMIAGIILTGLLGPRGESLVQALGNGALFVIGAYALGGAFYSPSAPSLRLSRLGGGDARGAHRWLVLLALAVGIDRVAVSEAQELGLAVEGLALLNAAVLIWGGVALWGYARYLRRPRAEPEADKADEAPAATTAEDDEAAEAANSARQANRVALSAAKIFARVAAVAAPVLACLGYYAASRYAFYPPVFSGAMICLGLLLFHVVQSVVGRVTGEDGGAMERLKLVPILLGLLLSCAAVPVLALIWGVAPSDLEVAWRRVLQGFTIGDVTISPVDFLLFIIFVVIGFIVTSRAKRFLRRQILPLTGLDTGGSDAIAAGAGYLGFAVTVLVAIAATGVDLSNLAIVAGALSVGIGFGLQNIVNNFVSGVILLIERPIKAGDWIELPSGMGYVKNINVRSTEVETFDRASLFVPNSQLISENVINWTHSNLHGRIICKVGVEYGTDPRKVERILIDIARAHPLMLRRPAPYVLFRGFGSDSLDFEIRGILRDVNWLLNVQSDLNYEIARRFTEEGIGIPFRQADISIKNVEEIGKALRGVIVPAPNERKGAPASEPKRLHDEAAGDAEADGPGEH
ncbi:DUF3772 domain-containing protein [Paralimibaculum aggregatum]|uniref:DUF3772 domain-containing protein n=1 Tax=Paralimibaculum aggregatum TaxID=3036245 RepID=A0ABQ6LPN9_9RHOB|nr:DUF3772 domain-containing protein [Limibaculum sp. NKW23]GMG83767.1 DUF3772 domain-containing protein [Limibaculum sp. NKW23]